MMVMAEDDCTEFKHFKMFKEQCQVGVGVGIDVDRKRASWEWKRRLGGTVGNGNAIVYRRREGNLEYIVVSDGRGSQTPLVENLISSRSGAGAHGWDCDVKINVRMGKMNGI